MPIARMAVVHTPPETVEAKYGLTQKNISIPDYLLKVIKKFADKIERNITIIGLTDDNYKQVIPPPAKDALYIYAPVNMRTFTGPAYNIDLKFSEINPEQANVRLKFLGDDAVWVLLNDTPADSVYTKTGSYCAYILKDEIVLLSDFLSDMTELKDEFTIKELLTTVLSTYEKSLHRLIKRTVFDRRILDGYMKFIRALKSNSKRTMRDKMLGLQTELRQHWNAIQRKEDEYRNAESLYRTISRRLTKNKQDTDITSVTKMFEPLFATGKYTKFEFTTNSIIAYTDNIKITYKSKVYEIGQFKVEVPLSGEVRFYNLTKRNGEYDHPHIHETYACFGNIKETVANMIASFMFLPLFDLIYTYLCSYTRSGQGAPFVRIGFWGGYTSATWCDDCDAPRTECGCNNEIARCDGCEQPEENCTCRRCPSRGDRMSEVDCDGCDSWNADNGNCEY